MTDLARVFAGLNVCGTDESFEVGQDKWAKQARLGCGVQGIRWRDYLRVRFPSPEEVGHEGGPAGCGGREAEAVFGKLAAGADNGARKVHQHSVLPRQETWLLRHAADVFAIIAPSVKSSADFAVVAGDEEKGEAGPCGPVREVV
jgi:hypothetical protein